ncbi:hypothetical protein LINBF2_13140 [Limnohabitans sp. INBF002]|nr:hypothetical protein LINBF2_13140 [Limnohabitans sp. INBF002]
MLVDAKLPVLPPLPSCKVPAVMVVSPAKVLVPVSVNVPVPSLVRVPPELVSALVHVTSRPLVSIL